MKPEPNDPSAADAELCPWCGHIIILDTNCKGDPIDWPELQLCWMGCSNYDDCPVQPRTYECETEEEAHEAWKHTRPSSPREGLAGELAKGLRWAMSILDAQNPCDSGCGPHCSNHKYRTLLATWDATTNGRAEG